MSSRKNGIQRAIEQLGPETVQHYLPKGMRLYNCEIHGGYLAHYKDKNPLCPLCQMGANKANGTDATDMSLYIDIKNTIDPGTNPHE